MAEEYRNGSRRTIIGILLGQVAINIAIIGWLVTLGNSMGDRFTGTQASFLIARTATVEAIQEEMKRRMTIQEGKIPLGEEVLRRLTSIETQLIRLEDRLRTQEIGSRPPGGYQYQHNPNIVAPLQQKVPQ